MSNDEMKEADSQESKSIKIEKLKSRLTDEERRLLADEVRNTFMTKMSREVRTPLNTIIGLAAFAKDRTDEPEYLKYCLDRIDSSAKHLLLLINDVLDISHMEANKLQLHPEKVKFREFIGDIVTSIRSYTNDKRIIFRDHIEGDPAIGYIFDPARLKQVIMNLLDNAVKFTPRYGTIHFIAQKMYSKDGKDVLSFVVKDTGVGIAPEFLPNAFDPFTQEYSGNTSVYGGTGMGLAICKSIIDVMGGNIDVKSEKGCGAEFRIEIPLEIDTEAGETATVVKTSGVNTFAGHRVLLAEDNAINCEIAKQLLERKGLEVDVAENGREALSHYMMNPPGFFDLIIIDVRMPYMDGLTATKKIRSSGKSDCKYIPIMAMTANAMDEDIKKSMQAGMNAHLTKPIDPKLLYNAVEEALNGTLDFGHMKK